MRRVLLLAAVATLGVAGVAYGATSNTYVLNAKVTPSKSGTKKSPTPIAFDFGFTAAGSPSGSRPAPVKGYKISLAGVQENTRLFKGCGTTTLSDKGPSGCPKGSQVGTGYLIVAIGATATPQTSTDCRAEATVFNGGNHNLTLYVYKGAQVAGQPAPCAIPNGHSAINIDLVSSANGVSEQFSVPSSLLHPAAGLDASTVKSVLNSNALITNTTVKVRGKKLTRKRGLLESIACPANHQRQVAATFTQEDGTVSTRTLLVHCS